VPAAGWTTIPAGLSMTKMKIFVRIVRGRGWARVKAVPVEKEDEMKSSVLRWVAWLGRFFIEEEIDSSSINLLT